MRSPSSLAPLRDRLPPWLWSQPAGLLIGLAVVLLMAAFVESFNTLVFRIPNPSLAFMLIVFLVSYGWGMYAGSVAGLASFLLIWLYFIRPISPIAVPLEGDWARLALSGIAYMLLVFAGSALRRVNRSNRALQNTVERLNGTISAMVDGVMMLDQAGNLIQSNEAMRHLFGNDLPFTLDERRQTLNTRQIDGRPYERDLSPVARALRGEVVANYEALMTTSTGEALPVSISTGPIQDQRGAIAGAVVVIHDLTAVRRLQQVKDDFLSVASHELKTPLTPLRGYAELLRERLVQDGVSDQRVMRYLNTIDQHVQRLAALVDSVIDITRMGAGQLQLQPYTCDLIDLVKTAVDHAETLSPQHTIQFRQEAVAIVGLWDGVRVEQIISSLLSNALRYSPNGGQVTVEAGVREQEAYVLVRDQGIGIEAEQLASIFERPHWVESPNETEMVDAQRGLGFGLMFARDLAQRHGGRIVATSPGRGSGATFTLYLPLTQSTGEMPRIVGPSLMSL